MFRAASIAMLGLAAGCAHAPVNLAGCDLPLTPLEVAAPSAAETRAASGYGAMIEAAMAAPATEAASSSRAVSLFLSGGSQNGAFGAGFLDETRLRGGLPPFRVVTGISTGALIGSTVFTGASQKAVDGYTIASEADLYDVTDRSLLSRVRAGAAGNFAPLRRRLDASLDTPAGDDALLADIAAADRDGRKFLAGVVDVRHGGAFAVDMTALASRWDAAAAADRPRIKQCYIEVLVASSSVPFAVPPVYIDGRMLVDGGLRFSVFRAAEAEAMARATATARAAGGAPPLSLVIVNGTLDIAPQCPFETDGACPATGTLRQWDIVDLGLRSVAILSNQVSRFSAASAAENSLFARIEPDALGHMFDGRTCAAWRIADMAAKPPPLEFHPREMRCLIDYGRTRAGAARWWEQFATP